MCVMQMHLWLSECLSASHAKAEPESTLPPGVTWAPAQAGVFLNRVD